jgi:hypothetical protein
MSLSLRRLYSAYLGHRADGKPGVEGRMSFIVRRAKSLYNTTFSSHVRHEILVMAMFFKSGSLHSVSDAANDETPNAPPRLASPPISNLGIHPFNIMIFSSLLSKCRLVYGYPAATP